MAQAKGPQIVLIESDWNLKSKLTYQLGEYFGY